VEKPLGFGFDERDRERGFFVAAASDQSESIDRNSCNWNPKFPAGAASRQTTKQLAADEELGGVPACEQDAQIGICSAWRPSSTCPRLRTPSSTSILPLNPKNIRQTATRSWENSRPLKLPLLVTRWQPCCRLFASDPERLPRDGLSIRPWRAPGNSRGLAEIGNGAEEQLFSGARSATTRATNHQLAMNRDNSPSFWRAQCFGAITAPCTLARPDTYPDPGWPPLRYSPARSPGLPSNTNPSDRSGLTRRRHHQNSCRPCGGPPHLGELQQTLSTSGQITAIFLGGPSAVRDGLRPIWLRLRP